MKFYHRRNGEVVGIGEPVPAKSYISDFAYWEEELKSLPVLAYCDPKEPIGWLQGYQERYEVFSGEIVYDEFEGRWDSCSKQQYDKAKPEARRIFLVKKGDEPKDENGYPIYGAFKPAQKDEQDELWKGVFLETGKWFGWGTRFAANKELINALKSQYRLSRKEGERDLLASDNATINTCGDAPLTCSNSDEQEGEDYETRIKGLQGELRRIAISGWLKENGINPSGRYSGNRISVLISDYIDAVGLSPLPGDEKDELTDEVIEKICKMADETCAGAEAIEFGEWILKNKIKPTLVSQSYLWAQRDVNGILGFYGELTTANLYKLYKKLNPLLPQPQSKEQ